MSDENKEQEDDPRFIQVTAVEEKMIELMDKLNGEQYNMLLRMINTIISYEYTTTFSILYDYKLKTVELRLKAQSSNPSLDRPKHY